MWLLRNVQGEENPSGRLRRAELEWNQIELMGSLSNNDDSSGIQTFRLSPNSMINEVARVASPRFDTSFMIIDAGASGMHIKPWDLRIDIIKEAGEL